ncbi:MAG: orotidine-5'-phosphate decarboxylase [Candidatus Campbellbacteria bacterium]|nr:orotidine-5'-phosphate decarboxylase [Candidatus Campbellbacteria bacterium]
MSRNFREMIGRHWSRGNFVCVGLDTDFDKIPKVAKGNKSHYSPEDISSVVVSYNKRIIEATRDLVCAYKLNTAFYEKHGANGLDALRQTIDYILETAADVPVILDAKRADIGNSNEAYAEAAFASLRADAITVHPYLGHAALEPFLAQRNKGIFVLCRTSNSGAGEFQDLSVGNNEPLYLRVARNVADIWNKYGNCALVVGATFPKELGEIRKTVGNLPILIPGIGVQGGDLKEVVNAGKDSRGMGMIINSSRGIIFASEGDNYAEAARVETKRLQGRITRYLL